MIEPLCDDLNLTPTSMALPSLARGVAGTSVDLKIEQGQSANACLFALVNFFVITVDNAVCVSDFIILLSILLFVTMLLCEIIKDKSGNASNSATRRFLAAVDKVVNIAVTFRFYIRSVIRRRKIEK